MHDIIILSQSFASLFTAANLPLLLLFGSGILAVTLLLLALTHWGHSRPVWKCVVLSVAAHILLMGYAYGTRYMWSSQPEIKQTAESDFEELQVTLVDDIGEEETTQLAADELAASELPTAALEMLEVAPLMRPEIDSEIVVEMPKQTFTPTEAPQRQLEMQLPTEQAFVPETRLTRDQELAMLPEAKIIDPEPIEMRRQSPQNGMDAPELAFDGDLQRQPIGEDTSMQPPETDRATQSDNSFAAANSMQLVQGRQLPRPNIASEYPTLDSAKPLPRPAQAGAADSTLQVLRRTRRIGDGQAIPQIYSLRNPANRLRIARERGGSVETEDAVKAALVWLATNQQDDGSWDPSATGGGREDRIFGHNRDGAGAKADTGITGLATLAFLAAGHSHLEGDYQRVVENALRFLIRQQTDSGDLSGDAKLFAKMYCHSISLLAISEALAMTGDQNLATSVRKGVGFSEYAQNRKDGGWRYQPGDTGDMSQFGWQVLALKSAKLGGVQVSDDTVKRMKSFLKSCSSGIGNGLASYRPNQGPSTTMTAEALLCRYLLDQEVPPMTLMTAQRQITSELPTDKQVNLYYWYYGTLAMYHGGGKDWEKWNRELKSTLLPMQIRQGEERGSFPANGMWGGYGGKVYSTAMATLNLEVYYRYLPIYQKLAESPLGTRNPLR